MTLCNFEGFSTAEHSFRGKFCGLNGLNYCRIFIRQSLRFRSLCAKSHTVTFKTTNQSTSSKTNRSSLPLKHVEVFFLPPSPLLLSLALFSVSALGQLGGTTTNTTECISECASISSENKTDLCCGCCNSEQTNQTCNGNRIQQVCCQQQENFCGCLSSRAFCLGE